MVTVSAAALMLAGVGASATNAGSPVHASRRTVRISNLRRDKYQIKNINRKIARLSRKAVKKGKRSKKKSSLKLISGLFGLNNFLMMF
ncbi:MAG: Hypothetical protein AJITA_00733 [Acetilactobacillus jinshanensis]